MAAVESGAAVAVDFAAVAVIGAVADSPVVADIAAAVDSGAALESACRVAGTAADLVVIDTGMAEDTGIAVTRSLDSATATDILSTGDMEDITITIPTAIIPIVTIPTVIPTRR